MAYTITDLAELLQYHLVVSAPDDDSAHANLAQLVGPPVSGKMSH